MDYLDELQKQEREEQRNQQAVAERQYNPRRDRSRMLHEDTFGDRFVLGLRVHDPDLGWIERRINIDRDLLRIERFPRRLLARHWRELRRALRRALA